MHRILAAYDPDKGSEDDTQSAVLFFIECIISCKEKPDDVIGFNGGTHPISGEQVVEGFIASVQEDGSRKMRLAAMLIGVTNDEFDRYGPPSSLQLNKEEARKRGLGEFLSKE